MKYNFTEFIKHTQYLLYHYSKISINPVTGNLDTESFVYEEYSRKIELRSVVYNVTGRFTS